MLEVLHLAERLEEEAGQPGGAAITGWPISAHRTYSLEIIFLVAEPQATFDTEW